jgi:hypothetical protein
MSLLFYLHSSFSVAHAWEIKTTNNGKPLHWQQSDVSFYYNPNNSGLSSQEVSDAIDKSAMEWSYHFVKLNNKGETNNNIADYQDGDYTIFFEDDWNEEPEILALTYTWADSSGTIIHFDIEINSEHFSWETNGSHDKHDLQNTLTHELGHAIGLDHSTIHDASMAASSSIGEKTKRELHTDDKEGNEYIYTHTLETQSESDPDNSPSTNSNGSSSGNDNPNQPNSLSNGSYGARNLTSCSTTSSPLSVLWITLIGLIRRLR